MAGKSLFEEFLDATFTLDDPWWGEIAGFLILVVAGTALLTFLLFAPRLFFLLLAGGLVWLIFVKRWE